MASHENEPLTTEVRIERREGKDTATERRPVLVCLRGELLATPIPLERDIVTIGRALEADIRLNDSRVSRLHAKITAETKSDSNENLFRVTDLGSTNGTHVNGRPVREPTFNNR